MQCACLLFLFSLAEEKLLPTASIVVFSYSFRTAAAAAAELNVLTAASFAPDTTWLSCVLSGADDYCVSRPEIAASFPNRTMLPYNVNLTRPALALSFASGERICLPVFGLRRGGCCCPGSILCSPGEHVRAQFTHSPWVCRGRLYCGRGTPPQRLANGACRLGQVHASRLVSV